MRGLFLTTRNRRRSFCSRVAGKATNETLRRRIRSFGSILFLCKKKPASTIRCCFSLDGCDASKRNSNLTCECVCVCVSVRVSVCPCWIPVFSSGRLPVPPLPPQRSINRRRYLTVFFHLNLAISQLSSSHLLLSFVFFQLCLCSAIFIKKTALNSFVQCCIWNDDGKNNPTTNTPPSPFFGPTLWGNIRKNKFINFV